MTDDLARVTFVVMARRPATGQVKTRLIREGFLDGDGAAALAQAMLECTVERLARRTRVVVVATTAGARPALTAGGDPFLDSIAARAHGAEIEVIDQGSGDLGERLDRAWRRIGTERRVAFFGADTPDVPAGHLGEIAAALGRADVAIGPTDDGGYWTLAAGAYHPEVLREIDWGSGSVYDQSCCRARDHGLALHRLQAWHDVDRPADVWALKDRLAGHARTSGPTGSDDALRALAERLDALLEGLTEPTPRAELDELNEHDDRDESPRREPGQRADDDRT